MKFLRYLEKAWLVAAVCALIVAIYNFIMIQTFSSRVYFPLICAGFCVLIWFNIRGQRRFREKIFNEGFGGGGSEEDLVFQGPAPAHITTPLKVYPIDRKIFLEVLQAISQR